MSTRSGGDMPRHRAFILRLWEARSVPPDPASRWRLSLEDVHSGEKHKFPDVDSLSAFLKAHMGAEDGSVEAPEEAAEVEQEENPGEALREGAPETSVDEGPPLSRREVQTLGEGAEERTVVCIEDEPDMISLIKLALERHRVRLIGALGGREGLEKVRRVKPDLVLLDLMMPDINGAEVLRQMKADAETRDIPIIVITVLDPRYSAEHGVDLDGVNAFIRKPFVPRELVERVNSALAPVA